MYVYFIIINGDSVINYSYSNLICILYKLYSSAYRKSRAQNDFFDCRHFTVGNQQLAGKLINKADVATCRLSVKF